MKRMMSLAIAVAMGVCLLSVVSQAMEKDPYTKPDGSWISISGTAVGTEAHEGFTLDYGEGTVFVEMDDWDWYDESRAILEGDKVTVYGRVDDDLYETTSIEASSVYVEDRNTYYYASAADEEGAPYVNYWVTSVPVVIGETVVRGTVTSKSGREFTIDTGLRKLTVDTIEMGYNPLDDVGYQQIDVGDYVSVTGNMDLDFWGNRELTADSVITLVED